MPRFLRPHHCLRLPEAEIGELLNDALLKRHRRGPKGGQIAAFPKEMIVAIAGITLGGIGSAPRLDSWRADAVVVACGGVREAGCSGCKLNGGCGWVRLMAAALVGTSASAPEQPCVTT